jgi:hypothetical protein
MGLAVMSRCLPKDRLPAETGVGSMIVDVSIGRLPPSIDVRRYPLVGRSRAWEDEGMEDRLVQIFATSDTVAGEMMRGRLEAEGIPTMVKGEGEGPYRAGPVYLWVAAVHEAAARDVVEAVRSGAFEIDESFEQPTGTAEEPQP